MEWRLTTERFRVGYKLRIILNQLELESLEYRSFCVMVSRNSTLRQGRLKKSIKTPDISVPLLTGSSNSRF